VGNPSKLSAVQDLIEDVERERKKMYSTQNEITRNELSIEITTLIRRRLTGLGFRSLMPKIASPAAEKTVSEKPADSSPEAHAAKLKKRLEEK